ncbi:transcription antitermination factor NusB [Nitriliruptor alkaliphilus]|uniref:transcription antitermination factor NusB n=1 Tax=Nitriliruptor alkaliphilus TaxID=427918 RepID=UPI000696C0CE|nr:transcription antitermination factor NusB [Nitriliruptor alkaliphilus]
MSDPSRRRQAPPEPAGLPARRAALAALRAVEEDGAWSNTAVPAAVTDLEQARDRSLASHLAYDTLRFEGTLDWALGHVLTRPPDRVEAPLRRVLRLGALQLLRTEVPSHAAVATSVALARESVPSGRAQGAGGFVNGVLRALDRQRDQLPWPDRATDPVAHLALTTAHPVWIVRELVDRFGDERAEAILLADDAPPGLTLRATGDRDALLAELTAAGVTATAGATPASIRAPGADPRRLGAFIEGRAVPQDEASQRVVLAADVAPGDRVLDLCAGPGGKTTYLAAGVGPAGPPVVAVELHPHRAEMVRSAAHRQGVAVDVRVGDAAVPPVPDDARFDVVLLDAPCTGLGTGRRRPEVRWRRTPTDVTDLASLQRSLVLAAADRVAPGGRLVYSVCTWTAAETTEIAAWLDQQRPDLEPGERVQLLPDRDDTDGMYLAVWNRTDRDADR